MSVEVATSDTATDDVDHGSPNYRYPGSPPFRDTELDRRLFRGRATEADTVLHSILSTNLFLLYAESGLGKTSLLNAGVMHELRARKHWPVSVRLNDPSTSPVQSIRELIETAASADPDVDLVVEHDGGSADGAVDTLWDLLASIEVWRDNELQQPVLILDQFEELFTLDWDEDVRTKFIEEFGEVVRGHRSGTRATIDAPPEVRFVIVIREDALGELDALSVDVPQIMRHRFRLGPLDPQQAESAVLEPARLEDDRLRSQRFEYTAAAAQEILGFLRGDAQHGSSRLAASVDPSQLQIVCQYVELAILPRKVATLESGKVAQIDASDLGGREGLEQILSDFYRRTIESLPHADQRAARELCENGLINRSGRRLSLERDEIIEGFGVEPNTLQALVDGRLLRADPRVGSVYYELAHDTLVGPIRAYRDEQRALQRRRRRRVIGIAAAVVAVIAIGAAIAIAAQRGSSESSQQPAIPLTIDSPALDGEIGEPGESVLFTVDADRTDPLVVVVDPAPGLNAVIDVTTANEARVTRQLDQNAGEGAERLVIPPVPEGESGQEIRVTSFDSTLGSFSIGVEPTSAEALTRENDESDGVLSGPNALGVYSVDVSADVVSTFTVTPTQSPVAREDGDDAAAGSSGSELKPLDLELEVIGPTGVGRRIDQAGARGAETVTFGDPTGVYHVVVRAKDGTSGTYEVELESSEVSMGGELEFDESVTAVVTADQPVTEFTFAPPDDGQFAIEVQPDGQFDPIIETESADGGSSFSDSGGSGSRELVLLEPRLGPFALNVSGFEGSTGGFEISAIRVESTVIEVGDQISGSGEGFFDVELDEGEFLALTVQPTEGGLAEITVSDPDGSEVAFAFSGGPSGAAVASIQGPSGTYRAIVSVVDGDGEFTASLTTPDVEPLSRGDATTGSGVGFYEVALADGELVELVIEPGSDTDFIAVEVFDPAGVPTGFAESFDGSTAVTPVGGWEGTYTVFVRSDEGAEFTASLESFEAQPLAPDSTTSATGNASFLVEVDDRDFQQLALDVGAGTSFVGIEVRNPDGEPVGFVDGSGGVAGFGGIGGTYVISVRTEDDQEFTLSLTSPPALVAGQSVVTDGDATFQIDALAGEVFELTVEPGSSEAFVQAEVIDPDGFTVAFDETGAPGAPLVSSAAAARRRDRRTTQRRGMAAVVMVVVLMMLNLIIIGVVVSGSRDHGLTTRRIETVKAFYAAEAGLNMAFREVLQNADEDGDGLVGSVSDDGDAANDPSVGDGRVMVTNAFASGRTTLSSSGRAGDARREIEAIIRD